MGRQKHERSAEVIEQNRTGAERAVGIEELVDVLASALTQLDHSTTADAIESILNRLVGPERETQTRLSSRHLICDETMCALIAQDLGVSAEVAEAVFLREPWKRALKMASWALDQADDELIRLMEEYGEEAVLEAADSDAKLKQLMAEREQREKLEGVSRRAMVARIIEQMAEDHGMGVHRGRPRKGAEDGADG